MKPRPQNYTRRKRRSAWPEATPTDIPNGYKWMKSFCGFNNFNTLRFFMTDLFLWSVGFGVKRAPFPIGLWLSFSCLGFSVLFRFCRCSSGLELVWRAAALRSSHRMNEKAAASLHISKQEVAWIEATFWCLRLCSGFVLSLLSGKLPRLLRLCCHDAGGLIGLLVRQNHLRHHDLGVKLRRRSHRTPAAANYPC